jgi:uncharacterized protein
LLSQRHQHFTPEGAAKADQYLFFRTVSQRFFSTFFFNVFFQRFFSTFFSQRFSPHFVQNSMKVILTGGTGLIGERVITRLHTQGYEVVALTRRLGQKSNLPQNTRLRFVQWDATTLGTGDTAWSREISGAGGIIHLAGEGIFDTRWTPEVKQRLVDSRITTTRLLVQAIAQADQKPPVMVSASAVGYYGDRKDAPTDESAPPPDASRHDFLANLCVHWEAESHEASKYGCRVANPRTGIVLAERGGALGRMIPVFRAFLGMPLGSGNQWFPWIHLDDVARGICFPLEQTSLQGAYNLASPHPVRMTEFCTALGKALHRPSWSPLSVPEFALRLGLGEAASSLVGGQKIIPKKLLEHGFEFQHTEVLSALQAILKSTL